MTLPAWHEEAVDKSHDRKSFDCGQDELNQFLAKHARQSHESGGAKTFCAIEDGLPGKVLGFYSLAPASLEYARMPEALVKGVARHDIGGFRLARLAVVRDMQGRGIGGQLLLAAGKRCLRVAAEAGGTTLFIDAKNDAVAAWYATYGAVPLPDKPLTLVLPLTTIRAILVEARLMRLPT